MNHVIGGVCHECGRTDGYVNVPAGPHVDHWGFCAAHGLKWPIGANLFTANESAEEMKEVLREIGFDKLTTQETQQ
jgi:thiamine biosynthesis lipoprotein ApbE